MGQSPLFSVVIPARNEERYLPSCLTAIAVAQENVGQSVEVIVVINRCSDRTEEVARAAGTRIAYSEARNLAAIRNAGAAQATGEILVTIDADSRMSPLMFTLILQHLSTGRVIGGGVSIWPERWSFPIFLTGLLLLPIALWHQIGGGLFFCYRRDFEVIGGFDERFVTVEDIDFAKRLRQLGKQQQKRFIVLFRAWIVTSCRKFDRFGDWYFLKNPRLFLRILRGNDQEAGNRIWYDFESQ